MPRGFEGFIRVRPETSGWGTNTNSAGYYLFADSESLNANQEFKDRPDKLTYGMVEKLNSRTIGPRKPGGDLTFQPRSDDMLFILMSHFQKYIGADAGSGTSLYTFVPCKTQPDWVGSTWGTGGYTAASGDMFTVNVSVKMGENDSGTANVKDFINCFADKLEFDSSSGEDLKLTAGFKAKSIQLGSYSGNPNDSQGSYSAKTPYEFFEGTCTIGGRTDLEIKSFKMSSMRNATDDVYLGNINPTKYEFGRYTCEGVVELDAPKETLAHYGSMLSDLQISLSGTWYNSSTDYAIISVPNAKYKPFEVNKSGGQDRVAYSLEWKAFESNDGSTSPVTIKVQTTGMGSAFNIV